MLTQDDIETMLRKIIPHLKRKFKVKEIGYFGSFSNNLQTEDSDVDILVEFSDTPGWEFFTLEEYLENIFNRKIDLVTKDSLKAQLKNQILKQVKYIE